MLNLRVKFDFLHDVSDSIPSSAILLTLNSRTYSQE